MQDPTHLIGQVFEDRFRVEAEVGRGSMAIVFRATHLVTEQVVALKVMKEPIEGNAPRTRRFLQEIRATARLSHPNTVRVLDAGQSREGFLWLAMEYIDGESLRHLLDREKRLAPVRSLHIARQIARALVEAHGKLLVHRDLKPENILLTNLHGQPDFVKVLDFGVAKFLSDQPGEEPLTRAGDLLGTPLYLAPEQALERSVDGRADLYSLGCILMEMITGDPPFRASTPVAIVMRHIHDPAPRLSQRVGNVPKDLDDLVAAMLEKDPEKRPETLLKWLEATDHLGPLADLPLPPHPETAPPQPAVEGATVLLEVSRDHLEARATTPPSPPDRSHPAAPAPSKPSRPREETEEDIVFLSDGEAGTLLLPREDPVVQGLATPDRPPEATAQGRPGATARPATSRGISKAWWAVVGLLLVGAGGAWWWARSGQPGRIEAPDPSTSVSRAIPAAPTDPGPPPTTEASPAPESTAPSVPGTAPANPTAANATEATASENDRSPKAASAEESLEVSLLTDPPGAEVLLNGDLRGRTPYRLTVRASDPLMRLTLRSPGYRDLAVTLLPRDLVASGRRDLTWQLQKGAAATASGPRTSPGPTAGKRPEAPPTRTSKKPALNWDE